MEAFEQKMSLVTDGVKCVLEMDAIVGESPVWCDRSHTLFWVDIFGQKIHQFYPKTGDNRSKHLDQPVTAIAQRETQGFVAALRDGFAFVEPMHVECSMEDEYSIVEAPERHLPDNRFNDGKCDRQGRFWGGTMNANLWREPGGALYRFDCDGSVHCMQKDTICSNGLGWSPDGKTMYFTESFRHAIFAYDFDPDTGNIANRRVFVKLDPDEGGFPDGFPDGLTVDEEGYVWTAVCGAGMVARYSPKGQLDYVLRMPVPRVTSCIFGGEDYGTMFLTSAQETMTEEQLKEYPLSGSLFSWRPGGLKGIPETPFKG